MAKLFVEGQTKQLTENPDQPIDIIPYLQLLYQALFGTTLKSDMLRLRVFDSQLLMDVANLIRQYRMDLEDIQTLSYVYSSLYLAEMGQEINSHAKESIGMATALKALTIVMHAEPEN